MNKNINIIKDKQIKELNEKIKNDTNNTMTIF